MSTTCQPWTREEVGLLIESGTEANLGYHRGLAPKNMLPYHHIKKYLARHGFTRTVQQIIYKVKRLVRIHFRIHQSIFCSKASKPRVLLDEFKLYKQIDNWFTVPSNVYQAAENTEVDGLVNNDDLNLGSTCSNVQHLPQAEQEGASVELLVADNGPTGMASMTDETMTSNGIIINKDCMEMKLAESVYSSLKRIHENEDDVECKKPCLNGPFSSLAAAELSSTVSSLCDQFTAFHHKSYRKLLECEERQLEQQLEEDAERKEKMRQHQQNLLRFITEVSSKKQTA